MPTPKFHRFNVRKKFLIPTQLDMTKTDHLFSKMDNLIYNDKVDIFTKPTCDQYSILKIHYWRQWVLSDTLDKHLSFLTSWTENS